MPAWYEDDQFWMTFYPAMYHEGRWTAAVEEARAAAGLLGLAPGARVLDACCGPGRHALALARMGFDVVGVDRTAFYLEVARERAGEEGLDATFVQEDVRAFRGEGAFDAAVSMYTSFGYFEDPAEDRRLLEAIRGALRPGGKALLEMSGKEVVARTFRDRSWSEPEKGLLFLEERTLLSGWEWVENRWVLIGEGERHERRFSVRVYSGVELKALMLAAGFASVELYGTLEGGPYDQTARRLVAVGIR